MFSSFHLNLYFILSYIFKNVHSPIYIFIKHVLSSMETKTGKILISRRFASRSGMRYKINNGIAGIHCKKGQKQQLLVIIYLLSSRCYAKEFININSLKSHTKLLS